MKLFFVKIRGGYTSNCTNYNEFYVVAKNSDEAYRKVRDFLNKENIGFEYEREMDTITLLAEEPNYPECRTLLFL